MNNLKEIHLQDYQQPLFTIKKVDLLFDIYELHTIVTNSMQIEKLDTNAKDIILDSIPSPIDISLPTFSSEVLRAPIRSLYSSPFNPVLVNVTDLLYETSKSHNLSFQPSLPANRLTS